MPNGAGAPARRPPDRRTYDVQLRSPRVGEQGFPGPPGQGRGPPGGSPSQPSRPAYGAQVVMGIGAFIALIALGWLIGMAGDPTIASATPLLLLGLMVALHVFAIVKRWSGVLVGFWSMFGVAFLVFLVACFALLSAL